jgi:hypothetical protein
LVHTHFLDVLFEIQQLQTSPKLLGQAQKYPPTPPRVQRDSLVLLSMAQRFGY